MTEKLILTENHIKIIREIFLDENEGTVSVQYGRLLGGGHVLDDIAMALGWTDRAINGSENSVYGRAFPDKEEKLMLGYFRYITENLYEIETLIHQSVGRFCVTKGMYKFDRGKGRWNKVKPTFAEFVKSIFS